MIKRLESITLFSENAKELAQFYREKVGLKQTVEAEMGDEGEELYGFEMEGSSDLYIVDHSKVKGKNKEPERTIFNLEVDNIDKEEERLKKAGVKEVAEKYHVEEYGYIATFEDLDGNYFQIVQVRPN